MSLRKHWQSDARLLTSVLGLVSAATSNEDENKRPRRVETASARSVTPWLQMVQSWGLLMAKMHLIRCSHGTGWVVSYSTQRSQGGSEIVQFHAASKMIYAVNKCCWATNNWMIDALRWPLRLKQSLTANNMTATALILPATAIILPCRSTKCRVKWRLDALPVPLDAKANNGFCAVLQGF